MTGVPPVRLEDVVAAVTELDAHLIIDGLAQEPGDAGEQDPAAPAGRAAGGGLNGGGGAVRHGILCGRGAAGAPDTAPGAPRRCSADLPPGGFSALVRAALVYRSRHA